MGQNSYLKTTHLHSVNTTETLKKKIPHRTNLMLANRFRSEDNTGLNQVSSG